MGSREDEIPFYQNCFSMETVGSFTGHQAETHSEGEAEPAQEPLPTPAEAPNPSQRGQAAQRDSHDPAASSSPQPITEVFPTPRLQQQWGISPGNANKTRTLQPGHCTHPHISDLNPCQHRQQHHKSKKPCNIMSPCVAFFHKQARFMHSWGY